jgi:hypothetical protein
LPPGLAALDAVFKAVHFTENPVVHLYPTDMFVVENAAETVAQSTVDRIINSKAPLAAAAFAVTLGGVAYIATRPRVKKAVSELFRVNTANAESV